MAMQTNLPEQSQVLRPPPLATTFLCSWSLLYSRSPHLKDLFQQFQHMRSCQVSGTKPSHAGPRQATRLSRATVELSCEETSWTVSQSRPARPTAQSSPSDERITRILEPLPVAELSCAELVELLTLTKSSGLGFTPRAPDPDPCRQDFRGCSLEQG